MTSPQQKSENSLSSSSPHEESLTDSNAAPNKTGGLFCGDHPPPTGALMMHMLPPAVRRRIKALKTLHVEYTNIEADFFVEVHKLECKYNQLYSKLYDKRQKIVSGEYEPTDDECKFQEDPVMVPNELIAEHLKAHLKIDDSALPEKGVPNFWLTIFKNVEMLNDMVQIHDEPILKHLTDIQVKFLESDPMGFVLEFHFSPNEYFTNSVLTKRYEMRCKPDENDPLSFEGPEIYKCKGCFIDWKKGKNVTMKTIKKKQKHRSHGGVRTVTKTVQNDSFFNFFAPPPVSEEDTPEEMDVETQTLLTSDFEIGHYIRERIVPHAVLYYTGEALEDEEEYEDDEESEEEGSTDSDENETVVFNKKSGAPNAAQSEDVQGYQPECKQQ